MSMSISNPGTGDRGPVEPRPSATERTPAYGTSLRRSLSLSRVDAVPSPHFPDRFRVRIFLYIVTLSLGTSFASTGIYYWRQRGFIERDRTVRANTLLGNLAAQTELAAYAGDAAMAELPASRTLAEADVTFVSIYDRRGHEIFSRSRPEVQPRPPPPEVFARLDEPVDTLPATMLGPQQKGDAWDDLYAPIVTLTRDPAEALVGGPEARRDVVGLARVGLSLQPARAQLDEMVRWGLFLGAAILAVGIAAAALISRRVSRPISALIQGADRLRSGQLDARVRIESRDELGLLAYSFNRMARRLNESMTALETLNRDLEAEVERRTAEVQRAADFSALLNAPLGRRDAAQQAASGGGDGEAGEESALGRLLDQVLKVLLGGTGARAAAVYLEPEERPWAELELERSAGADPESFPSAPPRQFLEHGIPFVDGDTTLAPLLLGDEVLGCLALVDLPPGEDLVRFAGQAALQLAVAVGNVRAYAAADRLARALQERNVALARQRDQLQDMNRLKSEFLANVSHELRTPLNAIIGYCELIADGIYGGVNEAQLGAVSGIDESGRNLVQLINQILDLAKVESGKMSVHFEEVDLAEVARGVVGEAALLALGQRRPYQVRLFTNGPTRLSTDGPKVKQILTNLVSNAVKFTRQGAVDVAVAGTVDGGCEIAVKDTGIGIKPQDLDIIFEEFRQVDGSYTREFGGTGLGLAIAKRFAGMLGGAIAVRSTVGEGSTFVLRLPARPPLPLGHTNGASLLHGDSPRPPPLSSRRPPPPPTTPSPLRREVKP